MRFTIWRGSMLALVLLVVLIGWRQATSDDGQTKFEQTPEIQATDEAPEVEPTPEPATAANTLNGGPDAEWIWASNINLDRCFLRHEFESPAKTADVIATCDNQFTLWVNGNKIGSSGSWESPVRRSVKLSGGKNEILVEARDMGSACGFAAKFAWQEGKDAKYVVTNAAWTAAETRDATDWAAARSIGKMGSGPWGNVFASKGSVARAPSGLFNVLPGFQVEKLFTVPKGELGSWVSIAFDDKGRLIASDQGNRGLCRITVPPVGSKDACVVEKLPVKMTGAQGMLHAFGALYVSVNGGPGSGFYRLKDTTGDDQYDEVTKLKAFRGGGEHGPHSVRLSPDGKSLYVIAGNHTDPPADFNSSLVPKNWSEDLLLPRQWDARGHARGKLAPGGWIARTDPNGESWEIVSIGYRNPYDMDFNGDGELFAYDADMEWDMGTPWYRPTRVNHATSGSEFGWRSGTGKWPRYYADSLPEVVDIGPGSPTGVTFGRGAKFPAAYQRALYLVDWTFGTIYAIHLTPQGASYVGRKEEFVSRTPLPLTDIAIGPDGAMYFTIGGRGTQSELFRVTYVGDKSTEPADLTNLDGKELRQLRRSIEAYHKPVGQEAVDVVWPHLAHSDRHIRYAARVALEHQPTELWVKKAIAETNEQALISAAIAVARQADKAEQPAIIEALLQVDPAKLSAAQQLEIIRAWSLVFIRMGAPDQKTSLRVAANFDPLYPAKSVDLNRELCRFLSYLNSTTVIDKTLALLAEPDTAKHEDISELLARNGRYGGAISNMLANHPDTQKIHYAFALRTIRYGWTIEQRQKYFAWFDVARAKSGGASYGGFINNIRKEAWDRVNESERQVLESQQKAPVPVTTELPKPAGPGRTWSIDELVKAAESGLSGRNFENGKKMFSAGKCVSCHRYLGRGGAQGPDLTNVAGRFRLRDLSEALIDPSKVISDQYRESIITTADGKVIKGRIVGEEDGTLTVMTDPLDPSKIANVAKDDVDEMRPSPVSPMPKELLNVLNEDEALDLLAYLLSRGNPDDLMFAKE